MLATKRAIFQSLASMRVYILYFLLHLTLYYFRAFPAFTIHTAVKQAKKAFVNATNPRIRTWGPTVTGLAIVPVLPYLFDKPVEHATDYAFDWIEKRIIENQTSAKKTDL